MKGSVASMMYDQYNRPQIASGDFVSLFDSLCEVVGSTRSKFGYKAFKIRYLSRPPLQHNEDWYPAIYVKKQIDGKDLRNGVLKLLSMPGKSVRLNPRHLRKAMRETALKYWNEFMAAALRRSQNERRL